MSTDIEPYFPEIKKGNNKRPPYSEIVKCLNSLGYIIQINEDEYWELKNYNKIPAICPHNHGVRYISIATLKKGGTCCKECGRLKAKKTYLEKTGYEHQAKNPKVQEKIKQTYENY